MASAKDHSNDRIADNTIPPQGIGFGGGVVGGAPPPTHVGRLPLRMPSEAFQATATTSADPASAWAGMQQPEVWEGIAGVERITDPEFHPDGALARFRFAATAAGRSYPGMAEVAESTPGQSMRLRLSTSELAATIALALQGEGTETRLTIDVEIRSTTFMASLFFPVVADVLGRGLSAAAQDFARRLDR